MEASSCSVRGWHIYHCLRITTITELLRLEGTSGDHLVEIPSSEQGQLQKVALCHVQLGFEYCQGWRLHNLCGQAVFHTQIKKKVGFFSAQTEFSVFQFGPIASCLFTRHH